MMSLFRCCAVAAALAISLPVASAQDLVKPGPEHEVFTKLAGDWTLTMKAGGMDSKGTVTYKSELGGLILTGSLEGEMFGSKFTGKYAWVDEAKGTVLPTITGTAFVNAEATLIFDEQDPFCWGIR